LSEVEVKRYVRGRLPEYMVPGRIVVMERLPVGATGKLDLRALPPPDSERLDGGKTYLAPRNPVEEAVAGIWAEVLRLERVGVDDNFLDLGGHSLLATQLIARVRNAFYVDLDLRTLLAGEPTVAGMAEAIVQQQLEQSSADDLFATLEELNELSDEQVRALLASEVQDRKATEESH
jgi:acyl carrier protein